MGRLLVIAVIAVLAGCDQPPSATSSPPSNPGPSALAGDPCRGTSAGWPPLQAAAPGPVTLETARDRAVALFRMCELAPATITELTSAGKAATGFRLGPNPGQPVWLVQVDAKVTDPSGNGYFSHFLIEVNQATGSATIVGQG